MKKFFKENSLLIAGLLLPIALAIVFFITTQAGMRATAPPKTSVLFASNYPTYNHSSYRFSISDQGLTFRYEPSKNDYPSQIPSLHLFDPVTATSRIIDLPDFDENEPTTLIIAELAGKKLSRSSISPDGYIFDKTRDSDTNLMTGLFGGGWNYKNFCVLTKNSRHVTIPDTQTWDSEFIAWVLQ